MAALVCPATRSYAIFGAGDVVVDPTNLIQNTMTALNTLKSTVNEATQIANQVTSLAHEVTMLDNEALNLAKLPLSLVSAFHSLMGDYASTLQQAQGIAYDVQQAMTQFDHLYTNGITGFGPGQLLAQARSWSTQVQAASRTAVAAQSLLKRLASQQSQIGSALSASEGAVGELQATQAGNELLGTIASQQASLQQIIAASARVQASLAAEHAAADAQARLNAARWLTGMSDVKMKPLGSPGGVTFHDMKLH
jgi:P-type conjugative transfer protein TrbJ